jgi:hypothetical protein
VLALKLFIHCEVAQIIEKGLCGGRAVSKGRPRQKKAEDVSVRVYLNIYLA